MNRVPRSLAWRRSAIALYFLITAVPFGLCALFGNLMFFQALGEEVENWSRRVPHDWNFVERCGFIILYMIAIDSGFLLLFGYSRFVKAGWLVKSETGNALWIRSATYNVVIAGMNGYYLGGTAPKLLLNPHNTGFWMVAIPLFGACLSMLCIGRMSENGLRLT
jgi:hypothetical protein